MIDLSTLQIQPDDVIIIWFEMGEWSISEVHEAINFTENILKDTFPNVKVLALPRDVIKDLQILSYQEFLENPDLKKYRRGACTYEASNNLY